MALLGAALLWAAPVQSQTVWNGNEDGTTWELPGNWSAGLPDADTQTRFLNGSLPDQPFTVTVGTAQTIGAMNFGISDERDLTINGAPLNLRRTGAGNITWNTSFSADASITVNSDIDFGNTDADTNTTFQLSLSQPITFNGDITVSGTGQRTFGVGSSSTVTINGANNASFMSFGGSGELIAGSSTALGLGGVHKTTSSTLSLRSDVEVHGSSYSLLSSTGNPYLFLRISELTSSSQDRTLTFNNRIAGSNGAIEWIDNVNSTGNLILELKYNAATAQQLPLITNASAIVRFAQAPSAARTYSGLISGAGSVELTEGGSTVLTAANTYTGATRVTNGTLLIADSGTIEGTSELQLGATGTFDLSGITASSYTFGPSQTISGLGTVVAGGKTINIEGSISPGNSPGTLSFDMGSGGILSLGENAVLLFELGTMSDRILLSSGSLNLGSATLEFAHFDFTPLAGFGIGEYILFETSETILGSLAMTSGQIGSFFGELQIQGTDLILTVIPEPGSGLLALLAACILLVGRGVRCGTK